MNVAVIGTGIAGNVAAYHLSRDHKVTVFEAGGHIGGHTHTHDIEWQGKQYYLDSGFMVFNFKTYPNFTKLLNELDVPVQPSSMSFSVRCERSGLEYNGTTLNSLFVQRRNFLRPSFYRMIKDILRFNREAIAWLSNSETGTTVKQFLEEGQYSQAFADWYLIPMGAAIWSADPKQVLSMPAKFFVRFFHNHGMLSVNDRPQWYVIQGGAHTYVKKLIAPFRDRIRTNTPVESIKRHSTGVTVKARHQDPQQFDSVFIATHSDQALRLLTDPTPLEREVLEPLTYQSNEAVLHTDERMLPIRRRGWAAWNYHIPARSRSQVAVTYNLNILQNLSAPVQFLVTLNDAQSIDPNRVIKRMTYTHPVFSLPGVRSQQRQEVINGKKRTYYCGAYWRYGFHEDGVVSALNALAHFRRTSQHAQLSLQRDRAASAI